MEGEGLSKFGAKQDDARLQGSLETNQNDPVALPHIVMEDTITLYSWLHSACNVGHTDLVM